LDFFLLPFKQQPQTGLQMAIEFSAVIPTFRRPTQLHLAIASVLEQRGVTLEVLVVDDSPEGSAQTSIDAINDRRVIYLRMPEPTRGVPSRVRNQAWPLCKGSFVHFLDDDDIVPDGHYAAVKHDFATHPEVGMVFGRVEPFGDVAEEQMQHEREFFAAAARRAASCSRFGRRWGFTARMMFNGLLLVTGAGVIRRECVERLGGFDPQMRVREDWDFYARVMRRYGAVFVDRVALKYRIGSQSLLHYSLDLSERDLASLRDARERKRAKYRAEYGSIEYFAVKLFAKTALQIL
jgi:glycosyltransferase involved in cell wall biosynthesis